MIALSDSNWTGDTSDRKSTSVILRQNGNRSVIWKSLKTSCVATSSTEAESIAMSEELRRLCLGCAFYSKSSE